MAFEYFLDGSVLTCVTSITDLGVSFSSNMSFSLHVTKIVNKALRMLGFIKRTLKPFRNTTVFMVLYNSYVRSRLDYCSPVWSPDAKYLIDKVERVQKRFIKHLCFINCIPFENERYASLCDHFQLTTLAQRRKITDLTLFHKILHGKVNCPYLLSCICFNLPRKRTRLRKWISVTVLSRKSVFYPTSKFAFTLLYFFLSSFLSYFDLHIFILTFIFVFMFYVTFLLCYVSHVTVIGLVVL